MKHEPALDRTTRSERIQFHLSGPSVRLDPRIHAVRHDLADVSLAGILFAPHYAKAQAMVCAGDSAFVRGTNSGDAPAVTQLLHGETFHMLDVTGHWAWGFCDHDGYVGYVERTALALPGLAPDYQVSTIAAPVFAGPDIKTPVLRTLPRGSLLSGAAEGDFLAVPEGYVHVRHARPIDAKGDCIVTAAAAWIGQPYVWGGRGAGGIDCSGLVQMALATCGISAPRDSDQQREGVGSALPDDAALQRGDLIFFPGHVGIMTDGATLLHANAYHMAVVTEPLADVIARLAPAHEQPVLARRRIEA